jgi:hypothetical protein
VQHQGTVDAVLTTKLVERARVEERLSCKHCGSGRVFRVFRLGYLQEKIYPLFGFYPWKCRSCKGYSMLHKRKRSRSKQKEYVEE